MYSVINASDTFMTDRSKITTPNASVFGENPATAAPAAVLQRNNVVQNITYVRQSMLDASDMQYNASSNKT
jgi:hypothetical protein